MKRYLLLAVFALCSATVGLAASAKIIPIPPPLPGDPIDGLAQRAVVLEPWRYEDLTIYPVRMPEWPGVRDVVTMDEAMERGALSIVETGSVNEVIAQNRGRAPVFLMAGEMIGGAKQDRTIKDDVLLPPGGRVRVPVYCVEARRWTGGEVFKPLGNVISGQVRREAKVTASQSAVWGAVAEAQKAAKAPSATGAFRSVYESDEVQQRVLPYKEKMRAMPIRQRDVSGVIVVTGGRFIVADIFGGCDVFERLWPKLLDSYAVSTFQAGIGDRIWSREDAQRLIRRIAHMRQFSRYTAGLGRLVQLEGAGLVGSALAWSDSVVHVELFPGGPHILPLERPMRNPEQRRQQLEGRVQ